MYDITGPHALYLKRGALLSIPDLAGLKLACREGTLWLTLDHDLRDIVLEEGQSFTGTQHRRALVYALKPACLTVRPVRQEAPAQPGWNWLRPAPAYGV